MQLILLHVRLRHNIPISATAVSRFWPANLVDCLYFCLFGRCAWEQQSQATSDSPQRLYRAIWKITTWQLQSDWLYPISSRGQCKTWTLDSGLDRGLDSGLHFGLHFGPDIGLDFVRMAQKACRRSLYLCLSGCLWELKWGRRGVATLRSAGGGWGSILQDYFCWGQHRESQNFWSFLAE